MPDDTTEENEDSSAEFPKWYYIPIICYGLQGAVRASFEGGFARMAGGFIGAVILATLIALGWSKYVGKRSLGMSKYGWSLAALVALPSIVVGGYGVVYFFVGVGFATLRGIGTIASHYVKLIRDTAVGQ